MTVVVTGAKARTHLNVRALAACGLNRAHKVRVVFGGAEVLFFNHFVEAAHVAGFFSHNLGHFEVGFAALGTALDIDRIAAAPHFSGSLSDAAHFAEHVFVQSGGDAAGFENQDGLGRNHVAAFTAI